MPNANPRNATPALDNAANAIKAGRIRQGRAILEEVLKTDPDNVLALLWMTKCVDDPSKKVVLFNRVLNIDPQNPHARKGLALYSPPSLPPSTSQPAPSRGIASPADTPPSSPPIPDTKLCPFCAETIRAQATVCRFCGRGLPQAGAVPPQRQAAPPGTPRKSRGRLRVVLVLAVLVVVTIGCIIASASVVSDLQGTPQPGDTGATPTMAGIICEQIVESHLAAPSTAEFAPWTEWQVWTLGRESGQYDAAFRVRSYVDAENSFGAMIRSTYTCDISYQGGDSAYISSWRLLDLQITP